MSQDLEEGEISDSVSVKQVKKLRGDCSKVGSIFNSEPKQEKTRVWTMQYLYNYQMLHNNAFGLYNLAWAWAVQNKPIHEVLVLQDHNTDNNKNNNNKPDGEANNGGGANECSNDKVVKDLSSGDDDGEREDSELEEGEIDFNMSDSEENKSEYDLKGNNRELERRIAVIREALESLITSDLEQSYNVVCFRVKILLDGLWEVVFKDSGSNICELIELAYGALNTLHNIFISMSQKEQELNKLSLSRLFRDVTSQNPPLFATEQMTEIENMIKSLEYGSSLPALGDTDMQNQYENVDEAKKSIDSRKLETSGFKGRGLLLSLVDLHKDHGEDSFPLPTGDAPLIMRAGDAVAVGRGVIEPEWSTPLAVHVAKDVLMPYYETNAVKAVCTYQQKFGQNSFHMSDLPSPTPSDDCDDGIGDACGGVSSSPDVGSTVKTLTAPTLPLLNMSSSCLMDICSGEAVNNTKNIVPLKPSTKSRDPRLLFANANTVASHVSVRDSVGETKGSKKQKPTDESVSNGPTLKRQKNGPTDLGFAANSSSAGSSMTNVVPNGLQDMPGTSTSNKSSLELILKELAVNPAILTDLYKMEQQKSVAYPVQNFRRVSSSSSELGSIPPDKLEKVHTKLRDPRRAPHSNTVQKVGSGGPNHIKTGAAPIPSYQEMEVSVNPCKKPNRKVSPLKNIIAPDITRQFIKDLKNIASVTQIPTVSPVIPKEPPLPPSEVAPEPANNQSGAIVLLEEVSADPSLSQNPWGDVEHLFEGLDEKQKVAFHKERARRIDEQKKMYAARKLCLVLDLDHTLLNSAKFLEVDPVHDEILRKKEEQDRDKPNRHLFCFPHMEMWTKLRPGIWNFLEKASKLFELHLYTMGNKRYATEMAKLLDPKGTLFSGRVISRGDDDEDNDTSKSKNLEGVLGMESGVVIIDDSIRVWPHNQLNLIVVERYIYFPSSRRRFGLLGPSLLEIDHDERPEAGTLASSLAVIERIHQNFFAHRSLDGPDVRNILALEQRKILSGCRIVFSRVFPVGEANPHLHPLWQTAEQFGAICTNKMDDQVTHVVANSLGTDKVNWARSTGRFVVHPGWVEASALLYRRANEQDFSFKP